MLILGNANCSSLSERQQSVSKRDKVITAMFLIDFNTKLVICNLRFIQNLQSSFSCHFLFKVVSGRYASVDHLTYEIKKKTNLGIEFDQLIGSEEALTRIARKTLDVGSLVELIHHNVS